MKKICYRKYIIIVPQWQVNLDLDSGIVSKQLGGDIKLHTYFVGLFNSKSKLFFFNFRGILILIVYLQSKSILFYIKCFWMCLFFDGDLFFFDRKNHGLEDTTLIRRFGWHRKRISTRARNAVVLNQDSSHHGQTLDHRIHQV